MEKNKSTWIFVILFIVLLGGFIIFRVSNSSFKEIKFEAIEKNLSNVDYAIVYLGELTDTKKSLLNDTVKDTRIKVNTSRVESLDELNIFLEKYELQAESVNSYLLLTGGEVDTVIDDGVEDWRFKELVSWYFFNEIPASEIAYRVVDSASEYEAIINQNKYTVTVFGYAGCTYCDLYMPYVNNLAAKYGIDIYYFDRDANLDLFMDVTDLGLDIPGKCVTGGIPTTTKGNFAKPMTLVTKKGKTVDCIKGYVKEEELEVMLRKYGIIKEKK